MDHSARLGEMKIIENGGQLSAIFQNLNYGASYTVQVNGVVKTRYDDNARIEYTHDRLFGHGGQPIDSRMMHPDDQKKIMVAKNTMIEHANIKKQQGLIDKLGVGGLIKPRP